MTIEIFSILGHTKAHRFFRQGASFSSKKLVVDQGFRLEDKISSNFRLLVKLELDQMNNLIAERREIAYLLILLLLTLPRFYRLGGGVVLGEPDEFIHQSVVENLHQSPWPAYFGSPWFFQMPLYPYLGFFLSFVFLKPYVALRVVSVLSSVFLILGTYLFFRHKNSPRSGFWAALFLALSPFSIYVSRLALLDSTFVSFGFLFLYAYQIARDKQSKSWSFLAGGLLTLALMAKYSALIYWLVFFAFFLFQFFKDNRENFAKNENFKINLVDFLPLAISAGIILPILYLMRKHDAYSFKLQLFTSLGFLRDFWRIKGGELSFWYYGGNLAWWLTWPVFALFPLGLALFLKRLRNFAVLAVAFLVTLLVVLPFRPFYPRYFYPVVPLVAILAGVGFERIWNLRKTWLRLLSLLLILTLVLPTSLEAFDSTSHDLVEKAGQEVQSYGLNDPWVFTNYWPNIIGRSAKSSRTTWLTRSFWDGRAYVPDLQKAPTEIFRQEGGFVLLEDLYASSRYFINPGERLAAKSEIAKEFPPVKTIIDEASNFPHFRGRSDRIRVYFNLPTLGQK